MRELDLENKELLHVLKLFFKELPVKTEIKNTNRGNCDFRETVIAEWQSGEKYVLKFSDNDFTFADKIEAWKKCAGEYRKLGYYCPAIQYSKDGTFPTVTYKGHNCVVYAEEYSKYNAAVNRTDAGLDESEASDRKYMAPAFIMTAKMAEKRFDFTDYPSGYCLLTTFCLSDDTDEVMENALEWKKYAETLPPEFQPQVHRIWQRWMENRNELEKIYHELPTSVFQADLNPTNILLDDNGNFAGVFDFNLCGKDVFLNYLFREIYWYDSENEIKYILETLKNVSKVYHFSDIEKQAAPLLYRCIKPLWYSEVERLKEAGNDSKALQSCLADTENMQTRVIDFEPYMNPY